MTQRKNMSQLLDALAFSLDLDRKTTKVVVSYFLELVKNELHSGGVVTLSGFGTFRPHRKEARRVRNPRVASGPGAYKEVEAKTVIRFKPGVDMKSIAA